MQPLLVYLTAVCYLVATGAYASNFQRKTAFRGRLGTATLFAGGILQTLLLGLMAVRLGGVPLTSQVLPSLCAWLVAIVYVYLEGSSKDRSMGALVVPIIALLHILGLPDLVREMDPVEFSGGWFQLHVLAYILAYAAFAISFVSAVMYVMLLGEIQQKHLGYFYERLPSLDVLDLLNNRAATFGFCLLTAGVAASTVWAYEVFGKGWVWGDPKVAPLLLAWVIYAGNVAARFVSGWQGRRAAILSIAGFTVVILTFPIVGVFFSGVHPFGN